MKKIYLTPVVDIFELGAFEKLLSESHSIDLDKEGTDDTDSRDVKEDAWTNGFDTEW